MHSQKLLCARRDFRFHAIIFIMKRWKDLKPITRYLILLAITLGLLINFGSVCAHYVREWIKAAQAPVTETAAPAQPSAAPTPSSVPDATEDTAGSYTVEEHPITYFRKDLSSGRRKGYASPCNSLPRHRDESLSCRAVRKTVCGT